MQVRSLLLSCLAAASASAQSPGFITGTRSMSTVTGSISEASFTGTYATDPAQSTASNTDATLAFNGTDIQSTATGAAPGTTSLQTLLVGGGAGVEVLTIINGTTTIFPNSTGSTTTTSAGASATNTQPCNSYLEFCDRKYSNITEVCAHNSAFVVKGNAASNQLLSTTQQLDDGIRMIQGETHYVNDTIYNCHTSCDLLNAGTWLSGLETVAAWVEDHPYDVVTLLIVNSDYITVENYTAPLLASGLAPYLYEPPYVPMRLNDWPTLSEMILSGKRVVVFMDYNANQTAVPYILDEFSQMWETPFSPTNQSFPCDVSRPPTLTNLTSAATEYLYLANHNLNQDITILGTSILLPNVAEINLTNSANDSYGALGEMAETCTADWGRAPNFLLVDYYNIGNGSVFEVAAKYNNVTYDATCCGLVTSAGMDVRTSTVALLLTLCLAMFLV